MGKPIARSLKEYGRGLAGGLLFSLPLIYTMEVWWSGFVFSSGRLLLFFLATFLILLGYNYYAGFRRDSSFAEVVADSIEELGLGLVVSFIALLLLDQIGAHTSFREALGKVVIESLTVAIGISVGTVQLSGENGTGTNNDGGGPQDFKDIRVFIGQTVVALCGAVLFAANVAPTEEIVMIAVENSALKLLVLALCSIAVGGAILYYLNFHGAKRSIRPPESLHEVVSGIIIMYAIALVAAAFLLWFFGRYEGISLTIAAGQTVVLGAASTLGASAGRLILQA